MLAGDGSWRGVRAIPVKPERLLKPCQVRWVYTRILARRGGMSKQIPTQLGDALILRTEQAFTIHVVGRVVKDGQQDFLGQADLEYVIDRAAAIAAAKALVMPGRQVFFRDIDTGEWSEISD